MCSEQLTQTSSPLPRFLISVWAFQGLSWCFSSSAPPTILPVPNATLWVTPAMLIHWELVLSTAVSWGEDTMAGCWERYKRSSTSEQHGGETPGQTPPWASPSSSYHLHLSPCTNPGISVSQAPLRNSLSLCWGTEGRCRASCPGWARQLGRWAWGLGLLD